MFAVLPLSQSDLARIAIAAMDRDGVSDIRCSVLPGFPRPVPIPGVVPHVTGVFDMRPVVVELTALPEGFGPSAQVRCGMLWRECVARNGLFIIVAPIAAAAEALQFARSWCGHPSATVWTV